MNKIASSLFIPVIYGPLKNFPELIRLIGISGKNTLFGRSFVSNVGPANGPILAYRKTKASYITYT